jgi:hypothetical protein
MFIMKKAVQMHENDGYSVVLEAYDAMWGRIVSGEGIGVLEDAVAPDVEKLVDAFIAGCLETAGENTKIQARPMYTAFSSWCELQGLEREKIPGMGIFGKAMTQRVSRVKTNYVYYVGIAFKEQEQAA